MKKVIMRKYTDESDWEETTLDEAIDKLSGYWKKDTIESMLLDEGLTLWNPVCHYKAVVKDESISDEVQQEKQITELMMKTFHFHWHKTSPIYYVCDLCGKRFSKHYSGFPMNERMIRHFENHHAKSMQ